MARQVSAPNECDTDHHALLQATDSPGEPSATAVTEPPSPRIHSPHPLIQPSLAPRAILRRLSISLSVCLASASAALRGGSGPAGAEAYVTSKARGEWRPYEDFPWYSLVPLRSRLLPPRFAKRHFTLPRINAVGIAFPELLLATLLLVGTVFRGSVQRVQKAEESGELAQFFFVVLFLFTSYRSLMAYLFGISFERSMFWHGYFATMATGYGIWHGMCALWWAILNPRHGEPAVHGLQAFVQGPYRTEFLTGLITVAFMLLTLAVSIRPVRRFFGRAWLVSHHVLPPLAVVFAMLHGASSVALGAVVYVADRLYGYLYLALFRYRNMGTQCEARVLRSGLVMLRFPKAHHFVAGQFMCVQVPEVSVIEYHAFSIASIPSDEEVVLLVKVDGVWTRSLQKTIESKQGSETHAVELPTRIHGPIGSVGLDWHSKRYNAFLLVAGGVGVTPMLSISRQLAEQKRRGRRIEVLKLVWSVRSAQTVDDVAMMQMAAMGGHRARISVPSTLESGYVEDDPGMDTKIFLTRGPNEEGTYTAATKEQINTGRAFGRVEWNTGRVDLGALFRSVHGEAMAAGMQRVAVLACGPDGLTRDVCKMASMAETRAVQFDVHVEHFK